MIQSAETISRTCEQGIPDATATRRQLAANPVQEIPTSTMILTKLPLNLIVLAPLDVCRPMELSVVLEPVPLVL
jgi:hypothetical protein